MYCKKCGNELAEGAAFCGKCGNSINMNSALQTSSPQCNKNTSNNWFANIDEKTIEKYCDGFSTVVAIVILLIFHSSIGALWSETSNKLVFFLHMFFFLGMFGFLEIPFGVIKLIYSIISKKRTFKVLYNIWYIILCLIISVISLLIFENTMLEIVFLIIAAIYGAIVNALCKVFE